MDELRTIKESSNIKINQFEERLNNKFKVEEDSIQSNSLEFSSLFEKDNSTSESFSVLKIKFERATLREASSFKKFMEKVLAEDNRNIIVELNECEFIDSSFFGVLVAGVKRLKAMDKKFYLVFNSMNKLPIFSATGLDKVFSVYSSIEEAIKA